MQPIPVEEIVTRLKSERKPTTKRNEKGADYTQRRRDVEFERDLRAMGFDVRGGVEV